MNNIDEEIKRLGLSTSEWSIFLKYDARAGRNLIGIAIERRGLTVAAWTGEDAQIDACAARDAILESLAIAWLRGHACATSDHSYRTRPTLSELYKAAEPSEFSNTCDGCAAYAHAAVDTTVEALGIRLPDG